MAEVRTKNDIRFDGALALAGDAGGERRPTASSLHVYVSDVDARYRKALSAGGTVSGSWRFRPCGRMGDITNNRMGDLRMYGLIGKIDAVQGQRDALTSILLEGVAGMPGCLSYVVATDPADADALWITEVWDDEASHRASLSLPSVQQAIAKGRPLIAGFGERFVTTPVGGHGLTAT
jgi:quinol monooxygenase YgiN